MAREKIKRKLEFKPIVTIFAPLHQEARGTLKLLHEEMEAIYLSDVLGLYQVQAALKMEVSRPTYTRILKSARAKIAQALASGYRLEIEDLKESYRVAVCKQEPSSYANISPYGNYIDLFEVHQDSVTLLKTLKVNKPQQLYKPALILPKIFVDERVNYFITSSIGEGLKNALLNRAVETLLCKNFVKEKILELI